MRKLCGIGAKCSVILRYLHPSKEVKDTHPNATTHTSLDDLVCIGQGHEMICRTEKDEIRFRHGSVEDDVLYCMRRWVLVKEEGSEEHLIEVEE